ncbi:NAD(+) diphosphatase [Kribbella flavida DSM 17836]|uniref:NAD(+) diphosphatase n=1 Tax=Kribbella flavida (strain DSM 17836 / JCM 10339 / NBRC 14399) TaxID=479435 RepID=D2PL97_KRIFD|nr:NAD(+) diphosphatase [Kribbella flavida]ADB34352.1 NAD(+) diphosphatase [Kribbella flavida DSM 17836]
MAYSIAPGSLALSRAVLDRAADRRRDEGWLEKAWAAPDTQVALVLGDQLAVTPERTALRFVTPAEAPEGTRVFLGMDREAGAGQTAEGRAVFAVLSPGEPDESYAGLREIGGVLDDREAGIAVNVVGLVNWHAVNTHCSNCGAHTEVADAGHLRNCPNCGMHHFPRSDPAIIVLVTDDQDRALLGRNENWPEGRYSTLAGFVEPGESLEAAVRREVLEESGVVVGPDVQYAGSQPWPLPASLMLGFYARATAFDIEVDADEIVDARWFSRDDLRAQIQSQDVALPGNISISRRLIEGWYGEELPGSW